MPDSHRGGYTSGSTPASHLKPPTAGVKDQNSRSLSDLSEREYIAALNRDLMCERARAEDAEAENERLREAIALHACTLDDRALGHPEHNRRDRDSIDNDLYNLVRRIDPGWWDERVPGMAGSPASSDDQEQSDV